MLGGGPVITRRVRNGSSTSEKVKEEGAMRKGEIHLRTVREEQRTRQSGIGKRTAPESYLVIRGNDR